MILAGASLKIWPFGHLYATSKHVMGKGVFEIVAFKHDLVTKNNWNSQGRLSNFGFSSVILQDKIQNQQMHPSYFGTFKHDLVTKSRLISKGILQISFFPDVSLK